MAKGDFVSLQCLAGATGYKGGALALVVAGDFTGTFTASMDGSGNSRLLVRSTAKVVVAVTSPGYAGTTLGTIAHTSYGSKVGRVAGSTPAFGDTHPDVTFDGTNSTIIIPLTDAGCVGDVMAATIEANTFVSGGVGNAAITAQAVTNNSTLAHVKPSLTWDAPIYRERVTGAFTFRVISLCRYGTDTIKLIMTGLTSGVVVNLTTSTMDKRVCATSGVTVCFFTVSSGSVAGFTQDELIKVQAEAYPKVGGSGAVAKTQDATDAGDLEAKRTTNLALYCDKNNTATVYAVLDTSLPTITPGVRSTSLAAARLAPFGQLAFCVQSSYAIGVGPNANVVHTLSDTCDTFSGWANVADTGLNVIIMSDPRRSTPAAIAMSVDFGDISIERYELRDIAISPPSANRVFNANGASRIAICTRVTYTAGVQLAIPLFSDYAAVHDVDGGGTAWSQNPRLHTSGLTVLAVGYNGSYIQGADALDLYYFMAGVKGLNCTGTMQPAVTGVTHYAGDFPSFGGTHAVPSAIATGVRIVNWFLEVIGADRAATLYGTDEVGVACDDLYLALVTSTGLRNIIGYNWQTGTTIRSRYQERYNIYGRVPGGQESRNTKGDSWTTADAARIGNRHVMNRVGGRGCVRVADTGGESGDYNGLGGIVADPLFVDPKDGVLGTGGGDYHLQAASPARGLIEAADPEALWGLMPYDAYGVAIALGGSAGAFQPGAAPPATGGGPQQVPGSGRFVYVPASMPGTPTGMPQRGGF